MCKQIFALALVLALVVGGLAGALHTSAPTKASAATDDWSGHNEKAIPFSLSITAGTPAVIVTAVALKAVCIRRLQVTNSASGAVVLDNGAGGAGSTHLSGWGVLANTPLKLTKDDLGAGIFTSVGTGLYLEGATGTISGTVFVEMPLTSPN